MHGKVRGGLVKDGEGRGRGGELPDKPHEPFSRGVLFCFQLVEHEVLQRCGFSGCRELSVSYFLVSLSQLLGDEGREWLP